MTFRGELRVWTGGFLVSVYGLGLVFRVASMASRRVEGWTGGLGFRFEVYGLVRVWFGLRVRYVA
jgi:hypothetical protein